LVTTLIAVFIFNPAHAQRTGQPNRKLVFQQSQEIKSWNTKYQGMGVIEPTHVAVFTLKKDRPFVKHGIKKFQHKLELSLKDFASQSQIDFLAQKHAMDVVREKGDLYVSFQLYAVCDEDARMMAETLIEIFDNKAIEELDRIKDLLQGRRDEVSKAEKSIPELTAKKKTADQELSKLKEEVVYQNTDEAKNVVKDLITELEMNKIDIAQLQAKVEALRKFSGKGGVDTQVMTQQMLITQEVELAGMLARLKAAQLTHQKAVTFIDLYNRPTRLSKSISSWHSSSKHQKKRLRI